jgi:hypothetical protein
MSCGLRQKTGLTHPAVSHRHLRVSLRQRLLRKAVQASANSLGASSGGQRL